MNETGDEGRETGDSGRRTAYGLRRTAAVLLGFALLTAACQKTTPPKMGEVARGIDPLADQVVFGSRTLVTDAGLRRAEVFSDTSLFYDDNTRMDMRVVRMIFFSASGSKDAVMTSRTARYMTRDNVLEARGNVVINTIDGRRLVTEQAKYDSRVNQISSDSAFVLTEEGREASGIGFVSDPDMNNLRIIKASRAKAKNVKVPGT